jgi:hypothetical protein
VSSPEPLRILKLALLLAVAALGGCNQQQPWWQPFGFLGNMPRPFAERHVGDPRFVVTPGQAGIIVQPIVGFQPETAAEVSDAVVRALQALNYPASTRPGNAASYVMAGRIAGQAPNGQALLTVELRGADGRVIAHHPAGLDPAEVQARPHTVDWNPLAQDIAAAVDALIQESAQMTVAQQRPPVVINQIAGLNPQGARDVSRALRWSFARMRQRVVDQPRPDAVLIDGAITMSRPYANTVNFEIVWTLRRADGQALGQARQANDVDVQLLQNDWPQVAIGIAEGASEGISQVLDQSPFTPATPLAATPSTGR